MRTREQVRKECEKRAKLLQRMNNDCFCPSSSYNFMGAYISALQWVLGEK